MCNDINIKYNCKKYITATHYIHIFIIHTLTHILHTLTPIKSNRACQANCYIFLILFLTMFYYQYHYTLALPHYCIQRTSGDTIAPEIGTAGAGDLLLLA